MVSFYKTRRGPNGGNGGNGSSIYITATSDIYALTNLSRTPTVKAEVGQRGRADTKDGANAEDLEVKLPLGTILTDKDSKEVFEVIDKQDRFLLCFGGQGGKGNFEFRSSTNTTPMYAQKGGLGQKRRIHLNLKLIADCGLVGFPNAGKSSLLKELTAANPKIGDYPFTTLEPNLGEINGKIIADIPGLIEGASKGKGLGVEFLKHVERVSFLLHCISCEVKDPKKSYHTIREELGAYNRKLLDKEEFILLTKTDLKSEVELKKHIKVLKTLGKQILPVSIHNLKSIEELKTFITNQSLSNLPYTYTAPPEAGRREFVG